MRMLISLRRRTTIPLSAASLEMDRAWLRPLAHPPRMDTPDEQSRFCETALLITVTDILIPPATIRPFDSVPLTPSSRTQSEQRRSPEQILEGFASDATSACTKKKSKTGKTDQGKIRVAGDGGGGFGDWAIRLDKRDWRNGESRTYQSDHATLPGDSAPEERRRRAHPVAASTHHPV